MTLCTWLTPSSLFLFSCILLLPLQQPTPCQSIPSVHPACMPAGCCSLAIDALIAVGHIEKIVLLVVILPGHKGTTSGAKAANSLHVRKPNPEITVTWAGKNFSFTVPLCLHWRLCFPRPKRAPATALLLHTGRKHFCTQGIYLKSHSHAVLQAYNRNSSDCSPVSQQWYGLKTERRNFEGFNKSKITSRWYLIFWNTLRSGCISKSCFT